MIWSYNGIKLQIICIDTVCLCSKREHAIHVIIKQCCTKQTSNPNSNLSSKIHDPCFTGKALFCVLKVVVFFFCFACCFVHRHVHFPNIDIQYTHI